MNKDNNPKKTARRKARKQLKFPENAACVMCGEDSTCALERHHPAGFAHDPDLIVPECKNCHAKVTEGQIREGTTLQPTRGLLEQILAQLENLAAFCRSLADAFDRIIKQLKNFIANLDVKLPDWRDSLDGEE